MKFSVYDFNEKEINQIKETEITCTAWDCLGEYWNMIHNGPYRVRLPGGRVLYSEVVISGESNVVLAYLMPVENMKVKVVKRWVSGDQQVELVKGE